MLLADHDGPHERTPDSDILISLEFTDLDTSIAEIVDWGVRGL